MTFATTGTRPEGTQQQDKKENQKDCVHYANMTLKTSVYELDRGTLQKATAVFSFANAVSRKLRSGPEGGGGERERDPCMPENWKQQKNTGEIDPETGRNQHHDGKKRIPTHST